MDRMTNLGKVLTARAAFAEIKAKLSEAGIDISNVKYITDLPGVLCNILPDSMAEQAAAILEDKERLTALLGAFTTLANAGALIDAIYRPSDFVQGEDVYA